MNSIDSQTFLEAPTVPLDSQSSLIDKDSQISAVALSALNEQPFLERSFHEVSDSLSSKHIKTIPTEAASDEEIIAYLKLDTWHCEKNREQMISALLNCFREQKVHLSLPDIGSAQLPNCLEKMDWVYSLEIQSTRHLSNVSLLTKLHHLKRLSLEGETTETSFLSFMPFLEELCISYNPTLESLSFLSECPNLTQLELHYNQNLKNLLGIEYLACENVKKLECLFLSGEFTTISFVDSLTSLKKLSVASNPLLENLSFLKYVPDLLELSLENNTNLVTLSGIEVLVKLIKINLTNTNIRNLLIIEDLPKLEYTISHDNTLFTRVKKSPLGLLRMNIKDEALQRVNLRPFVDSHENISNWIKRLTNKDPDEPMPIWDLFKTKKALSYHVLQILALAQKDTVFTKEILLPSVNDSMTSCSDRTLYYLNEIIRQFELYKTTDLPLSKAIPTFEKYYQLFLVKELARESAEKRNLLYEEIAVQLDFFQKLDVELPFLQTEYSHLYRASSEEIEDAESKLSKKLKNTLEWVRYLCLDPFWQQRLFREAPSLKGEFDRIEETKYEELEVILTHSPDHPAPLKKLEIRHKQKIVEMLGQETQRFLETRER